MRRKTIALLMALIISATMSESVYADKITLDLMDPLSTSLKDESSTSLEEDEEITLPKEDASVQTPISYVVTTGEIVFLSDLLTLLEVEEETFLSLDTSSNLPLDTVLTKEHLGDHPLVLTFGDATSSMEKEVLLSVQGVPELTLGNTKVHHGDPFYLAHLEPQAMDPEDGTLTDAIQVISSPYEEGELIDYGKTETFEITLQVEDNDGHLTTAVETIFVEYPITAPFGYTENTLSSAGTTLLQGEDRYRTSIEISKKMYQYSDVVILTSGLDFPDALSAGPLAVSLHAPILLNYPSSMNLYTKQEIQRLDAKKIIILGGEQAMSKKVENELLLSGYLVERISGETRFTTAIEVAKRLPTSSTIVLTNGYEFADAMSAGSFASKDQLPILLTLKDSLPKEVLSYIHDNQIREVILMGGLVAVSKSVEDQLLASNLKVTRIAGDSRFSTSVKVAQTFFPTAKSLIVTNGRNYADALSAAPYAAKLQLPIILTERNLVDDSVMNLIVHQDIPSFHFIGGEQAISTYVRSAMARESVFDVFYHGQNTFNQSLSAVKNGFTLGTPSGASLSQIAMNTSTESKVSLRYTTYTKDLGWQEVQTSGYSGVRGQAITGLTIQLLGEHSASVNIEYRAYIKGQGWTSWHKSGEVLGGPSNGELTAIEAKIVHGNATIIPQQTPSKPKEALYAYTNRWAAVEFKTSPSTASTTITTLPYKNQVEVLSVNPLTNWVTARVIVSGRPTTGYIQRNLLTIETHISKTVLTVEGINQGSSLPNTSITIQGDVSYVHGISRVGYYINGTYMGNLESSLLSTRSLNHGFTKPSQTGYSITIPPTLWKQNSINSLKVEMVGLDGKKEWETIYLNGTSDQLVFQQYGASFNYYADVEHARGMARFYSPQGIITATREHIEIYMDPSAWISHDTYRYMFLDLGYQPEDYTIDVTLLNRVLEGKGVLHNQGQAFKDAAMDFNINPFYLIAHAILETGHGTSKLATGNKLTHYHSVFGDINSELKPLSPSDLQETWYNVYGIGAYDSNALLWGTEYAYRQRWNSVYLAIYGGAKWIGNGYIARNPDPQNTNFKMRYNFNDTMQHQYAQDVMWAYKQSGNIKRQYDSLGTKVPMKYIIPLFSQVRP